MKRFFLSWLICFFVFLGIDAVYFWGMGSWYVRHFSQLPFQFNFFYAALAYVWLSFALYIFSVKANWNAAFWKKLRNGFLLGFSIYGVFNWTNAAILPWPLLVIAVDTLWGGVIYSASTIISCFIINLVTKNS